MKMELKEKSTVANFLALQIDTQCDHRIEPEIIIIIIKITRKEITIKIQMI
jgi:hypothetical protein